MHTIVEKIKETQRNDIIDDQNFSKTAKQMNEIFQEVIHYFSLFFFLLNNSKIVCKKHRKIIIIIIVY